MKIRKATGAIGAFVDDVVLAHIVDDDDLYRSVRDAILQHEVLFFRDQQDSAVVFQAFAARFGEILDHPAYPAVEGAPHVQILESTPEKPTKIEQWHSDMTFSATPPDFTLVHGQIIPEIGGDTMWASATAAYEALSEPMRGLLDSLRAVHDFRVGFQESLAEPGGYDRLAAAIENNPPVSHPVVRTHPETGRRALFVNPLFTSHIEGLTAMESARILDFLYQHMTTAEFTVRLAWEPYTVAIWDNRSVWHRPVNDYFPQARRLHRVTIKGTQPE